MIDRSLTLFGLTLLLAGAGCTARPAADPKAAPGLWSETITSTSLKTSPPHVLQPRVQLVCVDASGKVALPYYRARTGADCEIDRHDRSLGGAWTSQTVCHNPQFGEMTTRATVTGDFQTSFSVKASVKSSSTEISAEVTGVYQGPCPPPPANEPAPPQGSMPSSR